MGRIDDRIVRGDQYSYDDIDYVEEVILHNEIYDYVSSKTELDRKNISTECNEMLNRIKNLKKFNPKIAKSINLKFLDDNFYTQIPEELYHLLTCFPKYQNHIIGMSENTFNIFIKTVNKMLQSGYSIIDISMNFSTIIDVIEQHLDYSTNEYFEIDQIDYEALIFSTFASASTKFGYRSFEDVIIKNKTTFEFFKEKTQTMIEEKDILKKIDAVFILKYGLTLKEIQNIFKNADNIIKNKSSELYLLYEEILELTKMNEKQLEAEYNSISATTLKNPYLLKRQMQNEIGKLYNDSLFSIDSVSNSNIIEAPENFNMIIHITGAFSINNYENYKDSWNRNSPDSLWFSSSYISNEMICTAPMREGSVCYGFTNFEDNSLLNYGTGDLESNTNDLQQDWGYSYRENLTPTDMINGTKQNLDNEGVHRYYNELNYNRIQGERKKQPSYILMFRNNGELINEEASLKAQQDFKNLPIVIIDIDKILEQERIKFFNNVKAIQTDEDPSLITNKLIRLKYLIENCKKTCISWNKQDNFFLSDECIHILEKLGYKDSLLSNVPNDPLNSTAIINNSTVDMSYDYFSEWLDTAPNIPYEQFLTKKITMQQAAKNALKSGITESKTKEVKVAEKIIKSTTNIKEETKDD